MRGLGVAALLIGLAGCGGSDVSSLPSPSPTPGPAGRFVFVASQRAPNVVVYAVAENGTLAAADARTLPDNVLPSAITADPLGRFVFVARAGGRGGIQAFAIDRTSGRLSEMPGSPFDLDHQTDFLTVEPRGRFLWATRGFNGDIDTFAIDAATGALTPGSVTFPSGLLGEPTLRPDGRFLYVSTTSAIVLAYRADDAAGRLVATSLPIEAPDFVSSLAVDPAGAFLYLTTAAPFISNTVFLYRIDTATGALSRVPPGSAFAPGFDFATGNLRPARITFHPSGRFAYVADRPGRTGAHSQGFWAFMVGTGGALGPSAVGPFSTPATPPFGNGDPSALALDPAGRFAYVTDSSSNSVSAFAIDTSTGSLTPLGPALPTGGFPTAVIVAP